MVASSKPAEEPKGGKYDFGFDGITNKAWRKDKGDNHAVPDFASTYEACMF